MLVAREWLIRKNIEMDVLKNRHWLRTPQYASEFDRALDSSSGIAERCRTENLDVVKCVFHEINFHAPPLALTTRSISTQAPSGSAAAAIVVRAGKG